ncbi:MAG: hypothetical protein HY816_23095 [Candidatus Wallbacteria bacterium]|nr:hypothetical protein [Candidatus Wallbacteria bacterium]
MRRTMIATALVAVLGVGLMSTSPAQAGGNPGYDDISYDGGSWRPDQGFEYDQGYTKGGKGGPNAYGTDNWDQYVDSDQYGQYDQYGQTDQYSQYDQVGYDQYDYGYDQYGKPGRDYYPEDQGYDYEGRHPYYAPERRGFFDYDFGRRMLVPTMAEGGGYLMRDAISGQPLTGGRVAGGFVAGGIERFADYAGNYDRRNDAGSRIASNALGYGVGNIAYRGLAGDKIRGEHVAGGIVEGGIVGFGKYMGDEEPSAVNGLFWGSLTRFGGAMANRGISGDRMRGKDIGGEGLRAVVGALGYMGGNEQ